MLNLKISKVAITGGLACGKSLVCRIFQRLGAHVVSADDIIHQLLSHDTHLTQEIITLLGNDVVTDNQLDRKKIAQKVFSNPELLKALERLLHPKVKEIIEKQYQELEQQKTEKHGHPRLFIAEIPLLFEIGEEKSYDFVIAVTADENICRSRFSEATGYSDEEYTRRISRQLSQADKAKRANAVIPNNFISKEELEYPVKQLFNKLTIT